MALSTTEDSNILSGTKLGPAAARPFVWQHLFKEGKAEAMPRTEALAYAAAVCDQHVLPFWPFVCRFYGVRWIVLEGGFGKGANAISVLDSMPECQVCQDVLSTVSNQTTGKVGEWWGLPFVTSRSCAGQV